MKIVFVDTNIFFHCRDLMELPWQEICHDSHVTLVVPQAVVKEVDNYKNAGSSRKARKARKASELFGKMIDADGEFLESRSGENVLTLKFSSMTFDHANIPLTLRIDRHDDWIVAEAMQCMKHCECEVVLATLDVGPRLTAKRHAVKTIRIPDAWKLPLEQDDKDKAIAKLQGEVELLRKTKPEVVLSAEDDGGKGLGKVVRNVTRYDELTGDELRTLMELLRKCYPPADRSVMFEKPKTASSSLDSVAFQGGSRKYIPPTVEDVDSYLEHKYPEWINKVEFFFKSIPHVLGRRGLKGQVFFKLVNAGCVPAEHLIIEFKAHGSLKLYYPNEDDNTEKETLVLPQPPHPPRGRYQRTRGIGAIMADASVGRLGFDMPSLAYPLHRPQKHDRYGFYFIPERPSGLTSQFSLEVDEFRHGITDVFPVGYAVDINGIENVKMKIECSVTAKNLAKKVSVFLPVEVLVGQESVFSFAKKLISPF